MISHSFFQINLNIGFLDNETFINGAPLKSTGVTRMTCPAFLCMHLCLLFYLLINRILVVIVYLRETVTMIMFITVLCVCSGWL